MGALTLVLGGVGLNLQHQLRQAQADVASRTAELEDQVVLVSQLQAAKLASDLLLQNATCWTLADTNTLNLIPKLAVDANSYWALKTANAITGVETAITDASGGVEILNINGRSKPQVLRFSPPAVGDANLRLRMSVQASRLLSVASGDVRFGYYGKVVVGADWATSKYTGSPARVMMYPRATMASAQKVLPSHGAMFLVSYPDCYGASRKILCEYQDAQTMSAKTSGVLTEVANIGIGQAPDPQYGALVQVGAESMDNPLYVFSGQSGVSSSDVYFVTPGANTKTAIMQGYGAQYLTLPPQTGIWSASVGVAGLVTATAVDAEVGAGSGIVVTPVSGRVISDVIVPGQGFTEVQYLIPTPLTTDAALVVTTESQDADFGWASESALVKRAEVEAAVASLGSDADVVVEFTTMDNTPTSTDQTRDLDDFFVKAVV